MSDESHWFNRVSHLIEQNIRGVQYGVYTISGLALFLAVRTVRPFLKLVNPLEIPRHFFNCKRSFKGKVTRIDFGSQPEKNPVLIVDHYPLIPLPWKKTTVGLPVEVANIEVTLNGVFWMQSILVGKDIAFTPLKLDNDRVHSIVYTKDRKNIGSQLVSIGQATVSPMDVKLKSNTFYRRYYDTLYAKEEKAVFNLRGMWYDLDNFPKAAHHLTKTP